jgi:hypothetical protein
MLVMITFTSDKRIGLFVIGQRELEGSTTLSREGRSQALSFPPSIGLLSAALA